MSNMKDPCVFLPDLTPAYNYLVEYIRKYQGEKGYIDLQDESSDTIWAMIWEDDYYYQELQTKAVRVVEKDDIEIICDLPNINWSENDLKTADTEEWHSLRYDDYLIYLNTIYCLASNIAQYVQEEDSGSAS